MKLSLCALVTANTPLQEQISAVKAAGISQVEIEGVNGTLVADMTESDLFNLRSALDEAGLSVYALATDLGKIGIGDRNYKLNEVRLYPTMRAAKTLGTKNLRIFLHTVTEEQKNRDGDAVVVKTNRLTHLGDQFLMCIENGVEYFTDTEDRMTYALDRLYLARSVFNPAAYLAAGKEELATAVKTLLPRATYVRLTDGYQNGTPAPIGSGDCNLASLLGEIRKDTVLSLSAAEDLSTAAKWTAQTLTALGYTQADGAFVK
ncbi:MAG: sugar phosphate isomerase/epimerase [Clostridia bacterium]|nr:sugar phosphate isomerase/epimerase [Clostridia bacterium]